jgi:hypothetical protein
MGEGALGERVRSVEVDVLGGDTRNVTKRALLLTLSLCISFSASLSLAGTGRKNASCARFLFLTSLSVSLTHALHLSLSLSLLPPPSLSLSLSLGRNPDSYLSKFYFQPKTKGERLSFRFPFILPFFY